MSAAPRVGEWEAARCLVCGPDNAHGLRLRFRASGDAVEAEWTVGPEWQGWGNLLHGGIFAALHDDAAHWAMNVLAARVGVTTRCDVRFLRPIRVGDRVTIRGRVKEVGAKRATFATELLIDGAVVSTADVEYALVDPATLERVLGRPLSPQLHAWFAAR